MEIAIVEDSREELDQLYALIQLYFSKRQIFRQVDTYHSGESFLEIWGKRTYDMVFLDIMMDGISGVDVARKIRATSQNCLIVFVSASKEFALEGFEVRAFDYLVKPITKEVFERTMEMCQSELFKHIRYIEVKESRTMVKILLDDIVYTDYYNHYIQIHTTSRIVRSYQQFDSFSPVLLCYPQFLCCYRNCLVNMDRIASLDKNDFIMDCGERVPIIRSNRHEIYQKYADYQFLKINGGL